MLHSILSKLPKPLDLENLVQHTVELFNKYPPERLPGWTWSRVSSNSVLKTTRDFNYLTKQTLQDGERFFSREAAEISRQEAFQRKQRQLQALARRYKKPVAWSSATIFVAIVAVCLRRYDLAPSSLGWTSAYVRLQQRLLELWQRFSI